MKQSERMSRFEHNQESVGVIPSFCQLCRGDEPRCPDCPRPSRQHPSYYIPANEFDTPVEPGMEE